MIDMICRAVIFFSMRFPLHLSVVLVTIAISPKQNEAHSSNKYPGHIHQLGTYLCQERPIDGREHKLDQFKCTEHQPYL